MAVFGTKKFWMASSNSGSNQKNSQVLKNNGYISIQLHSVGYKANGNFWQNIFGGSDNIVLSTTIKYQSTDSAVESIAIQDQRKVRTNRMFNPGVQRNVATKVPATSDALEIFVKMTAVKNDLLQAKFDMLNKPEFQGALQLAPIIVGQIISITSLAKKLFTDTDAQSQLEASFAGIISIEADDNPIKSGKLTSGYIIFLSTDDDNNFSTAADVDFSFMGDQLAFKNRPVECTYAVFNVVFEKLRGPDENSNWSKKYAAAINNIEKVIAAEEQEDKDKILKDSKNMWIEGNALLDADVTYINDERTKIKNAALVGITKRYKELTTENPQLLQQLATINSKAISNMLGEQALKLPQLRKSLPNLYNLVEHRTDTDSEAIINIDKVEEDTEKIIESIELDANLYKDELSYQGLSLKFA